MGKCDNSSSHLLYAWVALVSIFSFQTKVPPILVKDTVALCMALWDETFLKLLLGGGKRYNAVVTSSGSFTLFHDKKTMSKDVNTRWNFCMRFTFHAHFLFLVKFQQSQNYQILSWGWGKRLQKLPVDFSDFEVQIKDDTLLSQFIPRNKTSLPIACQWRARFCFVEYAQVVQLSQTE